MPGFRPGSRAPFVPAKVAKTSDAPSGLIQRDGRKAREGEPTRCAQTRLAGSFRASTQRAGRQASDLGRRRLQGSRWKSAESYIPY